MNEYLVKLQKAIEPLRQKIINHKVYAAIEEIDDLKIFMQYHVFAVWDFMSLLKSLQNNLTCTSVPWFPKGSANTRYLINEIVAGEESDVDSNGVRKSHFELYLDAMKQSGAATQQIEAFTHHLKENNNLLLAFAAAAVKPKAKAFVEFTFETINDNKDYIQSAVFTFGREDLIPNMFMSIVNDIHQNFAERISVFKYYLERHIEVDGGHHSHLALEMTANLCGSDEQRWAAAEKATLQSLQKRINLWDGVLEEIMERKLTMV